MYVHMVTFGKGFKVRVAGPLGVNNLYNVEITNERGDSFTMTGSANIMSDLAEQFNQVQQEIMRCQEANRQTSPSGMAG